MSDAMKSTFGLVRRPWGVFYLKNKITGEQSSLKTRNQLEAQRSGVAGAVGDAGAKLASLTEPGRFVALRAILWPYLTPALSLPRCGPERENNIVISFPRAAARGASLARGYRLVAPLGL
jgi:hypothetical protein